MHLLYSTAPQLGGEKLQLEIGHKKVSTQKYFCRPKFDCLSHSAYTTRCYSWVAGNGIKLNGQEKLQIKVFNLNYRL